MSKGSSNGGRSGSTQGGASKAGGAAGGRSGQGNGGGWPSGTGKPSGGGRSNAPASGGKQEAQLCIGLTFNRTKEDDRQRVCWFSSRGLAVTGSLRVKHC